MSKSGKQYKRSSLDRYNKRNKKHGAEAKRDQKPTGNDFQNWKRAA